jgi:hypothetical protein
MKLGQRAFYSALAATTALGVSGCDKYPMTPRAHYNSGNLIEGVEIPTDPWKSKAIAAADMD